MSTLKRKSSTKSLSKKKNHHNILFFESLSANERECLYCFFNLYPNGRISTGLPPESALVQFLNIYLTSGNIKKKISSHIKKKKKAKVINSLAEGLFFSLSSSFDPMTINHKFGDIVTSFFFGNSNDEKIMKKNSTQFDNCGHDYLNTFSKKLFSVINKSPFIKQGTILYHAYLSPPNFKNEFSINDNLSFLEYGFNDCCQSLLTIHKLKELLTNPKDSFYKNLENQQLLFRNKNYIIPKYYSDKQKFIIFKFIPQCQIRAFEMDLSIINKYDLYQPNEAFMYPIPTTLILPGYKYILNSIDEQDNQIIYTIHLFKKSQGNKLRCLNNKNEHLLD